MANVKVGKARVAPVAHAKKPATPKAKRFGKKKATVSLHARDVMDRAGLTRAEREALFSTFKNLASLAKQYRVARVEDALLGS